MATPKETKLWNAVLNRDTSATGEFFYAVKTTGVYCRPTCASRRPLRKNVEFFATTAAAREQGYRACKRCRPDDVAGNRSTNPINAVVHELARQIEANPEQPFR
jgi:AraC family transcriptional regulator of adaptative response/methylated-DNA-[protein]-cysteine methyltransferase